MQTGSPSWVDGVFTAESSWAVRKKHARIPVHNLCKECGARGDRRNVRTSAQFVHVVSFAPGNSGVFALAKDFDSNQVSGMESHEVLREVLDKCNAKQIAADMGLSLSLIYKWAEPDEAQGSGTANPLDRIEALVKCSNDQRIVQWICERAGGFFIKNPKAQWPHPHFLIPATNQIVQEFADLLAVIASAAADNTISKQEAKSIRARWEELKCVTEGFVRCCEEGNFSPLKKEPLPPAKP